MSQNPQEQQASQQQDTDKLKTELLEKINTFLKNLTGQDTPEIELDEIVITDDKCEIEVEADTQQSGDKCSKSLKDYIEKLKTLNNELENVRKLEDKGRKGQLSENEKRELNEKRKRVKQIEDKLNNIRRDLERDCGLPGNIKTFLVAGEYYCEEKEGKKITKITIYLSCYRELERCRSVEGAKRFILETLAHELIHHLQYTGAMLKVGNEEEKEKKKGKNKKGKDGKEERKFEAAVRYNGCNDSLAKEVNNRVPYLYRPHEVEAFARQQAFFDLLSGDREVRKVVSRLVDAYREVLGV